MQPFTIVRGIAAPLPAANVDTDVIMPNMSGIELAELVLDQHPHVGVVLLSGYTAETLDLERVTTRGATFVPKPVTSGQLIGAVQQARASRQADPREQADHP